MGCTDDTSEVTPASEVERLKRRLLPLVMMKSLVDNDDDPRCYEDNSKVVRYLLGLDRQRVPLAIEAMRVTDDESNLEATVCQLQTVIDDEDVGELAKGLVEALTT